MNKDDLFPEWVPFVEEYDGLTVVLNSGFKFADGEHGLHVRLYDGEKQSIYAIAQVQRCGCIRYDPLRWN